MLFQTVVLFLLCASTGTCATLGHYQTQSNEQAAPAVESAAVTEAVVVAASVDAARESVDAQTAEKPVDNNLFGGQLLAKILAVDHKAAKEPEGDVQVTHAATAEEPGKDKPATEALTEPAASQRQTSSEEEWNEIRPVKTNQSLDRRLANEDDGSWSLNSIRNSFQAVHGYFDSMVELVGGHNGVCEYRCKYGKSESLSVNTLIKSKSTLLLLCICCQRIRYSFLLTSVWGGYRRYQHCSYTINTDALKQKPHLICATRYRDMLLMCLHAVQSLPHLPL